MREGPAWYKERESKRERERGRERYLERGGGVSERE